MLSHKIKLTANKKIILIFCGVTVAFVIIIARLCYLQINLTDSLLIRSQQNFLYIDTIRSPRGNILDRNGTLLATNRPTPLLYWHGTGNYRLNPEQQQTLQHLEMILQIPITSDVKLINAIQHAERHRKQLMICSDVSLKQLSEIAEQVPSDCNVFISTDFKRYYPHKSYASHLLGYLGNINLENHGKMGLEKLLEESLKGQNGTMLRAMDSVGRNIRKTTLQKALMGDNIQITLDITIQDICERVFPKNYTGAFIVMEPVDGSLLSILSRPNFDPSIFLDPIPHKEWRTLQERHPFLNRAFCAAYPPGSLFKLATISAALETNLIPPDTKVTCEGFYYFCKRKYWCHRHDGHGELTAAQALAHSCNILFFEIGRQIDIDLLADYAHKFGLGENTNIIFPEHPGLVPTRKWKEEKKGEPWWPGETLSVAIGQSFLLTTPIQVARMVSAIFTGYLVKPRILLNEAVEKQPLQIAPETRMFLKKSMKRVVTRGTGKRIRKVKDIKIYAKTSTAQTSAIQKRNLGTEHLEHAWFVGNFSYRDNQPLTIVILVEHAGTSQVATTIAKNFLIEYKKLIDQKGTQKRL